MTKKRERPDPKRPQLWYGYGTYGDRLRILYPDGRSEWSGSFYEWKWQDRPCWQRSIALDDTSFASRVRAMKAYDKEYGRKTLFLGNI